MRRREEKRLQREQDQSDLMVKCCMNTQRYYRGWKARQRREEMLREKLEVKKLNNCALMIQHFFRMGSHKQQAMARREAELKRAHAAATFVRKLWLGHVARQRYLQIQENLVVNETTVVVLQRFARGFLVRRRMKRNAVLVQDYVWAAVEIQRNWRGYVGRLRFEEALDIQWSRQFAAQRIQKVARGFLGRRRCLEIRRRLARLAFEKARERFRSAQRIQAMVRGALVREVLRRRQQHIEWAVVTIQSFWRITSVRKNARLQWQQKHAPIIQRHLRGFVVRRRRQDLERWAALIQANYRLFCNVPHDQRAARREAAQLRASAARTIQYQFQLHEQKKLLQEIAAAPRQKRIVITPVMVPAVGG